jgi:L-lactate dehydrogenase
MLRCGMARSRLSQESRMNIPLPAALDFCRAQLAALQVEPAIAEDVATHLVGADQAGYASHGLSILPRYRQAIADGPLVPNAQARLLRDDGMLMAWDGALGFGQHVGKAVVAAAMARARARGSCVLTLRHVHHLGRMGSYGEQAAAGGLALLAWTNVIGRPAMVAPFGGRQARLTTNPMCFALPLPGREPLVLDMATSQIAMNRVRVLAAAGEPVPAGALVDAQGRPTTDGRVMEAEPPGALLPFGGHKGYGLGLVTELLAGLLSGGGTVTPEHQHGATVATNNLFALVIDPAQLADPAWLEREAAAYIDYLHGCPPAPGFAAVQYPGEYEAGNRARHAAAIELDAATIASLQALAAALGTAPLAVPG